MILVIEMIIDCLQAALNIPGGPSSASEDVSLGPDLETLKEFSLALDPTSRGWAVSNSEKIREGEIIPI